MPIKMAEPEKISGKIVKIRLFLVQKLNMCLDALFLMANPENASFFEKIADLRLKKNKEFENAVLRKIGGMNRRHSVSGPELQLLFEQAKKAKGGCIVEIGSYFGISTIALAHGTRMGAKRRVYAVDPQKRGSFREFGKNVNAAGVEATVFAVRDSSKNAASGWKEKISLLFIDGGHTYKNAKTDILEWSRHLEKNGTIVVHDVSFGLYRNVGRAAREEIMESGKFSRFSKLGSMLIAKKN